MSSVSMPKQGRKHRTTVILDPDQVEYVERRAEAERWPASFVIRRAIDLMRRVEPLPADARESEAADVR